MNPQEWVILVVEDEYDSIQMVSKILGHHGVEVHIARDGNECLNQLKTLEPTLIMMDLALPMMDGWETLVQIRANPATADLRVVAMTAYHSVSVQEDAMQAGFDAYFSKPLDTVNIIHKLAQVIDP